MPRTQDDKSDYENRDGPAWLTLPEFLAELAILFRDLQELGWKRPRLSYWNRPRIGWTDDIG